ncbi:MAG: HepT-like ribonuclease domain-containing protein [Elainellaceae cyanobacterium]
MQRDLQFLLDMQQSAELIMTYTADVGKAEFVDNVQLQDAVIRRLLIIAEAARRVSEATRQSLPAVSWLEIDGMRNRLVHEYDDVNLNIVWDVI